MIERKDARLRPGRGSGLKGVAVVPGELVEVQGRDVVGLEPVDGRVDAAAGGHRLGHADAVRAAVGIAGAFQPAEFADDDFGLAQVLPPCDAFVDGIVVGVGEVPVGGKDVVRKRISPGGNSIASIRNESPDTLCIYSRPSSSSRPTLPR